MMRFPVNKSVRAGLLAGSLLAIAILPGCSNQTEDPAARAAAEQELQALRADNQELQRLRAELQDLPRLRRENEELKRLREQTKDLEQLRQENAELRGQLQAAKQPKKP